MRRYVLLLVVPLLLMAVSPAAAAQYTIAVSATAGGVVNAPALKGKNLVADGGSLAVGFTANDGYYLAEVKIDKVPVAPELLTDPKTFSKDFTDVKKNYTVAAKFVRDPFITASVTAGGTITPGGKNYVPYGTDKTFTIQPNTGYHLTKVLVDGVDKGLIESWTFDDVKAKHALKAYFTINTYAVTTEIAATPGAAAPGTITPSMATMKHGQTKVFTIKPAAGLKVEEVTVNDVPQEGIPASGPCKVSVTATGDTKIGVVFSEIVLSGTDKLKGTYNLVFSENSFHVSSNGGNTYVGRNMTGNRAVASFNGAGACSINFTGTSYSRQGDNAGNQTVLVEPESGSMKNCTYVIDTEGKVTITLTTPEGSETLNGWSSPDGNVFIAGGPLQRSDEDGVNYDADLFTAVKAGSGITKASVAGSYQLVSQDNSFWKSSFGGSTYVNDNIYGNKVRATFDGNGGCTIVQSGTDFYIGEGNTVVSSPENSSTSDCTYSITSAGVMTLNIAETDGIFKVTAWASADGNAFVTGGPSMDTEPDGVGYNVDHNVGVREGSGMSTSSLSGTYKLLARNSEFWKPAGGGEVGIGISSDVITATFDGIGGCTVQVEERTFSAFGNVFNSSADSHSPAGCAYALGTNGALTLTLNGTEEVAGWVGADTNTILLGGPQTSGDEEGTGYGAELVIGVKVK